MYDVLIVGGGPSGLTAGLYAVRAGLSALLLERELIGGQASTTDLLMNYPGFPDGVGGPELMMRFQEQAEKLGLEIRYERPDALEVQGAIKRAITREGQYEARSVILSMGASRKPLGIENETRLTGRGISYCATCDGALYAGRRVAVVGGGYSAVEDALYLAQRSDVLLIHRRDRLRAVGAEAEKLLSNPRVQVAWNSRVSSVEPSDAGLALGITGTNGDARTEPVAGLFVAIGTTPNTELVKGQLTLDQDGYIPSAEDALTELSGVFAAGDIRKKPLRQVVTAVADGAVAASAAVKFLQGG